MGLTGKRHCLLLYSCDIETAKGNHNFKNCSQNYKKNPIYANKKADFVGKSAFWIGNVFVSGDSGGTLTHDTQNRNLMLYTTELRSLAFGSKVAMALENAYFNLYDRLPE